MVFPVWVSPTPARRTVVVLRLDYRAGIRYQRHAPVPDDKVFLGYATAHWKLGHGRAVPHYVPLETVAWRRICPVQRRAKAGSRLSSEAMAVWCDAVSIPAARPLTTVTPLSASILDTARASAISSLVSLLMPIADTLDRGSGIFIALFV